MATGKRAGAAQSAFARAHTQPRPQEPQQEAPTREQRQVSKWTVKLDPDTAATWDELALRLRHRLGRRVDKREYVEALVALMADDPALFDQVATEIERQTVQQS